jgi:hypothetical protein
MTCSSVELFTATLSPMSKPRAEDDPPPNFSDPHARANAGVTAPNERFNVVFGAVSSHENSIHSL